MIIPPLAFSIRILGKATVIWIGLRAGLIFVGVGPAVDIRTAVGIAALSASLAVFDILRRNEHVFMENLGVSRLGLVLLSVAPPVVFESACAALLHP